MSRLKQNLAMCKSSYGTGFEGMKISQRPAKAWHYMERSKSS